MEDASCDDNVPLPGFRFHPTDEELVGFYLRRKVEKKPIKIELIKQTDIYKHDPWDLPKYSNNNGDKEWYFFCKRGRKYKNSIRPNRVTGSGFWKATGIDKPVYSSKGPMDPCSCAVIGLKKSLVYYTGSAGKGTKTEWMMHEFRLPQTSHDKQSDVYKHVDANAIDQQEAEVWTLCRIMKRDVSSHNKRYIPADWRESASKKRCSSIIIDTNPILDNTNSEKACSMGSNYICFSNMPLMMNDHHHHQVVDHETKPYHGDITTTQQQFNTQPPNLFSGFACNDDMNELLTHGDWEYILDSAAGEASTNNFC